MDIKNVSFVGAGALGILYASRMLEHLAPEQLQFIVGPERMKRYRQTEFSANGARQDFRFASSEALDPRPADLVILTVKAYGLDDAISLIRNYVGPDTLILSFLNGISSEEAIAAAYGPARVVPCLVSGLDATRTDHSVRFSSAGCIFFGASADNDPQDMERIARFFDAVDLPYSCEPDITRKLWWKFMLNVGTNQTSALLHAPYGLFQDSPDARQIATMAMREVCALAGKRGIDLGESDIAEVFAAIDVLDPAGMTSMCQDVVAGRRTEVDIFAGMVMKLGHELDVSVPVNAFLFHALRALEQQQADRLQ